MKQKRPSRRLNSLASNGLRSKMGVTAETPSLGQFYEILEFHFSRTIPSLAIRASSVVGLTPRISAAPPAPRIRQPVC